MRRYLLAIMALALITAIGMVNATSALSPYNSLSQKEMGEPVLKMMQVSEEMNESETGQLILMGWNNFVENFEYENEVINRTASGNLSFRDAMILTTVVLTLNSQVLMQTEKLNPGEDYADFHSYTLDGMRYFNVYLVNMAKLFQTRDGRYSRLATDGFNASVEYYKKGRAEAQFLF